MSTASRKAQQAQRDPKRPSGQRYGGGVHPATAKQEAANAKAVVGSAPGSATRPAPATAAPVRADATWNTWKGHGHPASFAYLGRSRAVQASPIDVTAKEEGSNLVFRDAKGLIVSGNTFGFATKFWAVVAPAGATSSPVNETTAAVQRAAGKASSEPKAPKQLHPCKCGCGQQVKNLYAQGHDARHVSQLATQYFEVVRGSGGPEDVAATAKSVRAEVAFSDRLTAKLNRSIELIDEKAAKKTQAQATAKAA